MPELPAGPDHKEKHKDDVGNHKIHWVPRVNQCAVALDENQADLWLVEAWSHGFWLE